MDAIYPGSDGLIIKTSAGTDGESQKALISAEELFKRDHL